VKTFDHPLIAAHLARLREMLQNLANAGAIDTEGLALISVNRTEAAVSIFGCACPACRNRYATALTLDAQAAQPKGAMH